MSAASFSKNSYVNLNSCPPLLKNCPLTTPAFLNDASILSFSIAHEKIFQKSSSAVYKSCDTDFNLDKGLSNALIPFEVVNVDPKSTSSSSLVRSPSFTLEFTTPNFKSF